MIKTCYDIPKMCTINFHNKDKILLTMDSQIDVYLVLCIFQIIYY